jgi:hypothetical protein
VFKLAGDLADKVLFRALKKEEKRKTDAKESEKKEKKKKTSKGGPKQTPSYGYGWNNPGMGFQPGYNPQAYNPYPQMGAYPRGPETRICTNCRQQGHLMRNCPHRQPPSAAVGVAPK